MIEPEVRAHLISIIKTAKLSTKPDALVDALAAGCEKRGVAIVDGDLVLGSTDDHLALLKRMRRTIADKIEGEISGRDLAALTRRLQDISKDITGIEEKISADQRRGGKNNGTNSGQKSTDSENFDPSTV